MELPRLKQAQVAQSTLNRDRDWPVLTDYRSLRHRIFRRQWGLGPAQVNTWFPGAMLVDLQLV
ncbi:hypothetical protein ACFDAU_04205 [Sulfuriferula sp. GW1]|uniref:hypothetical protein n=1 Tax=Sulfuriferula sp. GW1 TaxID=3345111 RepID=UPI0039B02649